VTSNAWNLSTKAGDFGRFGQFWANLAILAIFGDSYQFLLIFCKQMTGDIFVQMVLI
jgi:hypothetical protein